MFLLGSVVVYRRGVPSISAGMMDFCHHGYGRAMMSRQHATNRTLYHGYAPAQQLSADKTAAALCARYGIFSSSQFLDRRRGILFNQNRFPGLSFALTPPSPKGGEGSRRRLASGGVVQAKRWALDDAALTKGRGTGVTMLKGVGVVGGIRQNAQPLFRQSVTPAANELVARVRG